jgi:hypothetical protein
VKVPKPSGKGQYDDHFPPARWLADYRLEWLPSGAVADATAIQASAIDKRLGILEIFSRLGRPHRWLKTCNTRSAFSSAVILARRRRRRASPLKQAFKKGPISSRANPTPTILPPSTDTFISSCPSPWCVE